MAEAHKNDQTDGRLRGMGAVDVMSESDGLRASLHYDADRVVITLSGEIDTLSGPMLTDLLASVMEGSCVYVEIDMTEVSFIDNAGLRVLLRAHRLGLDHGIVLILRRPPPHLVWLLQITENVLPLIDDPTSDSGRHPGSVGRTARGGAPRPERRNNSTDDRAQQADERDRVADERDRRADERDRLADERDRRAEDLRLLDAEKSQLLDERLREVLEQQRWEDIREEVANERERHLEQRERDC